MTNMEGIEWIVLPFIFGLLGILMMIIILFFSISEKRYNTIIGLLVFIFSALVVMSIVGQIATFWIIFNMFWVPTAIALFIYRNIAKSSIIASSGSILTIGFIVYVNIFKFDIEWVTVNHQILALLVSIVISYILLYNYNKNTTYSIIGSLIGLTILILSIFIFTFFDIKIDTPLKLFYLLYLLPIFIGFTVFGLCNRLFKISS